MAISSAWGFIVLLLNFPLNIGVTMSNKAFFRFLSFQLPVTLAAVHMLFCGVLPRVMFRMGIAEQDASMDDGDVASGGWSKRRARVWALAVVWALHIAMSNIGLRSVSVHLFVLVKCAGPVSSALLSFLMLGRRMPLRGVGALLLLVLGPALAVHAEVDVSVFGVAATVLVVVLTSLKVTLSTLLFSTNVNQDSLALLASLAPRAFLLLLPWSVYEVLANDASVQAAHLSPYMLSLLGASGVFAFFLNFNNFVMFKYMDSPVAVAVFTNVRKVLTIAVSVFVFEQEIRPLNVLGMIVTFLGVGLYTAFELREKRNKAARKKENKLEIV